MYTVIYELYRLPEVSQEQMVEHWLETHKPIAMRIPNVRGYRICPVSEAEGVEGEQVAGFVIFEFDSRADFDAAHDSPEFEATAADAKANMVRHFTRYAVDAHQAI